MASRDTSTVSAAPAPAEMALHCPACGYDLRGASVDRCSECGLVIDRASLRQTAVPWAHRRRLGRGRAFLRTVHQFTFDSTAIRHEASRPQDLGSARRFRLIIALALATAMLGVAGLVVGIEGDLTMLAVQVPDTWYSGYPAGWIQEASVPWSAGATLWPVLPMCMVIYCYYLAGAQQGLVRWWRLPAHKQAQARTLLLYAGAPLLWVVPGMLVLLGVVELHRWAGDELPVAVVAGLVLLYSGFILGGLVATLARAAQWRKRLTHGSSLRALVAAVQLLLAWIFAALVCFGLLPWSIGFSWIAIDSLR